jgi:acyl-CoA synthetase (NDP forming)
LIDHDSIMSKMESKRKKDISAFFEPRAVAVFGSLKDGGPGYGAIKNMLDFGFAGNIYPVNPSQGEVLGLTAHYSLAEVTGPVDLAMVIIPPAAVPGVIEQCAQKGIKAVIIGTEGFAEASEDGAALQQQVVNIAHLSGLHIIGPNTIGVLNTANGLATVPYHVGYKNFLKGGIAYCGQTGLISAHSHPMGPRAYPLSKLCDFGNKCDVDEVDLLNYLSDDPETKVIVMELEDVKDGRNFVTTARRAVAKKPVLVFKPGRSQAGAKAAASHTSSLAGDDRIYEAAFKQAGILRANNWQEFWEIPRVFASQALPRGNRTAILSISGGGGIVAADTAVEAGLAIATFTDSTVRKLAKLSPRLGNNPVDYGPLTTLVDDPVAITEEIISLVLSDEAVDCGVLTIYGGVEGTAEMLCRVKQNTPKPITVWLFGPVPSVTEELYYRLASQGLATYLDLETSIKALGIAVAYSRIKSGFVHEMT